MIAVVTAVVVVALDQLTKLAIVHAFARGQQVSVLGTALRIGYSQNSGAVFGIMKSGGRFFTVFSMIAAAVMIAAIPLARRASWQVRAGLGLVLGGAVGNLIDRLRLGGVVDFIDIGANDRIRWPSFNVADMAITAGVILLLIASLRPTRCQCPADEERRAF
ncbi:MAG TPA: signal peptidase II [bacterium]|nr:signal peptidase II [bacterium]